MENPKASEMTDIRQSPEYANYLSQIGWTVERKNGINYFIKKLPLIGSILKIQRPEKIRYKDIKILSAKHKVFQTIIEPKLSTNVFHNLLLARGFKLSKSPYLPTKTLLLDLTVSRQKLFKNLKKDARYALKRTMNYELRIMENVEEFRNVWKRAVGLKRYVPPVSHLLALKKAFKENCLFLTAGMSAGAIFLMAGKSAFGEALSSAYYWQAFTNKEGRKLQLMYEVVWEGILWAKTRGAKIFDFEGIYDERFPNKSWLGFTHFKKSFGGKEVLYPGCYTKFRFPYFDK